MKKRVFIVHGWDGFPEEGWFPWLKSQLQKKGFEVIVPLLPEASKPRIYSWVPALVKAVGEVDKDTYFVGHSMGNQAIARFLEQLPEKSEIGGAVFVAGFFKRLIGLENNKEVQETDKHWLKEPINLAKVKSHLPKSVAIFSEDDPWVPLDNQDDFREKLGSKILILDGRKHFLGEDGINQLPEALSALLEMANEN